MREVKMEVKGEGNADMPELDSRLSRLIDQISDLSESAHRIGNAVDRLGVSNVTSNQVEEEMYRYNDPEKVSDQFLPRFDDILDRLEHMRQQYRELVKRLEKAI